MVSPRPEEFTAANKLTNAVTPKFREGIYKRLSTTFDFAVGNITPVVVLDVMQEELDKLRTVRVDDKPIEPSPNQGFGNRVIPDREEEYNDPEF